jgi:hypothetical protein
MSNVNIFEVAVKNKFRFPFKGQVSVEDLFDLSVENLDSIFRSLNSELKQVTEESLLNTKSKHDKELDAKIEIVKYIFSTKLEEQNKKAKEKERRETRQKLEEILHNKQNEELLSKTPEEIQAMLAQLED